MGHGSNRSPLISNIQSQPRIGYGLDKFAVTKKHGNVYDFSVIRRLYVHNFRCLENFELPISGKSSALLIGRNGAGKTTVSVALEILQKIAQGTNRVREIVRPSDLTRGRMDLPVRFEIEVELKGKVYAYTLALEFPEGFKELRVFEEKLVVDGAPIYTRALAQVHLVKADQQTEAKFGLDWHLVALPVVQEQSPKDPLFIFKQALAHMLILRPIPSLIDGESESKDETLAPKPDISNLGGWFSGLLANTPSAYTAIDGYLKQVMPDLKDIKNPVTGTDSRRLIVQFSTDQGSLSLPFKSLSDGEKCFMICALVLAANDADGSVVCFWDEPDNYLALPEVGHFVLALRKAFQYGGQFIATSHNEEAIRRFSDDNTLVLYRNSHLEPTIVRSVDEMRASGYLTGDLVPALVRGDV